MLPARRVNLCRETLPFVRKPFRILASARSTLADSSNTRSQAPFPVSVTERGKPESRGAPGRSPGSNHLLYVCSLIPSVCRPCAKSCAQRRTISVLDLGRKVNPEMEEIENRKTEQMDGPIFSFSSRFHCGDASAGVEPSPVAELWLVAGQIWPVDLPVSSFLQRRYNSGLIEVVAETGDNSGLRRRPEAVGA